MTEEEILPAQGHPQAHGGCGGLKGRLRGRLSVSAPGRLPLPGLPCPQVLALCPMLPPG